MGILSVGVGFVAGCIVWNYFGTKIKVWLHLEEAKAGAAIKNKIGKP
jgi:hypothetical protein